MSNGLDPAVSVVVPTCDRRELLRAAVASLREQTLKHIQIIIVDDGSTDGTAALCERFRREDPRIRTIRTARLERSAARNAGLKMAHAPWLAFLDDDDLLHPEALEMLHAFAESRDSVAVASRSVSFRTPDPSVTPLEILSSPQQYGVQPWPPEPSADVLELAELLLRPLVPLNAGLFRRDWLQTMGGFDTDLTAAEDYRLWLHAAREQPIPVLEKVLALVRHHSGQSTHQLSRMARGTRVVLERFMKENPEAIPSGHRALLRARLGFLGQEEAYANLLTGHRRAAATAALAALRHQPASPKAWTYLAVSPWPTAAYGLLRRVFRKT